MICRELRVSRKVVRKVIRSQATEFRYERGRQPLPRIDPWRDLLDALLLGRPVRFPGTLGVAKTLRFLRPDRYARPALTGGLCYFWGIGSRRLTKPRACAWPSLRQHCDTGASEYTKLDG